MYTTRVWIPFSGIALSGRMCYKDKISKAGSTASNNQGNRKQCNKPHAAHTNMALSGRVASLTPVDSDEMLLQVHNMLCTCSL